MIDQRLLEQISESNDIVTTIEQYLPLKKSGTNFKACCPFHDEKTASFTVSPKKQIYKCFGCGKGGNVIQFVKEIERISFFEAAEKLALRAGIKLKSDHKADPQKATKVSLLHKIYELSADFYSDNLEKFGDGVLTYLEKRGITKETIKKYRLGYAPNSKTGLYNYLLKNNINKQILSDSGLFIKTQYGEMDLFRERIIFPIHSYSGKVVAFGARNIYEHQGGGKYINSPTTPLYTKGNELYGFHLTRHEVGRKNSVLVTEGYLDFLKLLENGFTNSAATLGTAFTSNQIKLLSRYTQTVHLLYDGDLAGRKAAIKAAGSILAAGLTPLIINLPLNQDADDFLDNQGKDALVTLIDKAETLTDFLLNDRILDLQKKEKLDLLIDIIKSIPDQLNAELLTANVANSFRISPEAIGKRLRTADRTQKAVTGNILNTIQKEKYLEEKNFLIYLLNGELIEEKILSDIDTGYFFVEEYKKVFETLSSNGYIMDNGKIMSIMSDLEENDPDQINTISELSFAEVPEASIESVIVDLKLRKYQYELKLCSLSSETDKIALFSRKKELMTKIKQLSKRVINKMM
jgi:DNA primase